MFQAPALSQRVKISLTKAGALFRTYAYDTPASLAHWFADKLEAAATHKKVTYGHMACLTFPLSIMVRNGARSIKAVTENPHPLTIFGGLTGVGLAATGIFGAIAGGSVLAGIAAGAAVLVAAVPGFILGVFGMATLFGATVTALSALPAALNISVGIARSREAFNGILPPLDPEPEAKPAPPPPPEPPEINPDEATTLNSDLTFKKVRISFRRAGEQAPAVTEFKPTLGTRQQCERPPVM